MHEFQVLVRRLHEAGIEVILDVVYNHTAEGNHLGPTLSFRGIDNASYYMLGADKHFYFDTTGTGNTVNLRHPRVLQMVMDSLRYWVEDCHVDGFRFDLATSLGREYDSFDPNAVFFDAVRQDPVLSRVKMIAEPWDVGPNGYQVGNFPPGWAEWNGRYRDEMRSYWKGDRALLPAFSRGVLGSADLFEQQGRKPWASVNFITAHDGFTLTDLWSYNSKHNEANGEDNRDGHNDNRSWNCGVEGPTDDPAILDLRDRMRRGSMATLLLSQGTPMILMGDEVGRTQNGNNNAYCQDNEIAWLEWKNVSDRDRAFMEFVRGVIRMRKRYRILHANRFLHGEPIDDNGTRSVVWYPPRRQGDGPALLERHQRQGRRPAPLRQDDAAPDRRQLLSPADPVHAAGARTSPPGRVRIDSGTGEIDPPDRRFAPGAIDRAQGPHAPSPRRGGGVIRFGTPSSSRVACDGGGETMRSMVEGAGASAAIVIRPLPNRTLRRSPLPRFAGEEPRAHERSSRPPRHHGRHRAELLRADRRGRASLRRRQARRARSHGNRAPATRTRSPPRSHASRRFRSRRCEAPDGRRLLRAGLAEERPLLGHRLPALFAPLEAQLGHRRFRGSRALRRDRRGGGRRFRRRQSAARALPRRAGSIAAPSRPRRAQFLNPLYIAIDKAPGFAGMEDALEPPDDIRDSELVDYRAGRRA